MKQYKLTYFKRDFNKWSIFTLAIVLFMTIPLLTIIFQLFYGPGELWSHIVSNVLVDYVLNSFWLLLGCLSIVFMIGVSSAWLVSRYYFPFSKQIEWLLILPLALPSYITAYAYAGFFDYGGSLSFILKNLGIDSFKIDIMNLPGLIFILSISLFPYVYVVSRGFFLYQSGRLIESSKLLGVNEKNTFFKVILPLARPAIVGGLLLVAMEVLNDYGAAKYYGISTFTTGIFRTWFSLEDAATAIYLCAILLVIIFLFVLLEKNQRKHINYEMSSKSSSKLPKISVSKKKQWVLVLLLSIPIFLGFILPIAQLLYWSFLTFASVASYSFLMIALQSLWIAFVSAFFTVLFALLIVYIPKWNRLKILKKTTQLSTIGYAIPGAVLAIGVLIPLIAFDKWIIEMVRTIFSKDIGFIINGTIFALIYAYVIRFLAVAFNPIQAHQLKIGGALSESSRLLGKGNLKTFLKIDLPLLKPALMGAFILVFMDTMKELPLTLILKPYNIQTLAVKAYEYASDELILEASLPSLCIVVTGIIPVILLNKFILNDKTS